MYAMTIVFREKAAKEAGIDEEEESDDDVVNPFRNIQDQIVRLICSQPFLHSGNL